VVGDVGSGSEQDTLLGTTCARLDRSARLARVTSRIGPCFRSKARPNATHHGAQGTHGEGTVL
jgi:hypothetical protein